MQTWVKLKATTNSEPKARRQAMKKTVKNIGLDVHKISIGIAGDGRDGEIRYYGKSEKTAFRRKKQCSKLKIHRIKVLKRMRQYHVKTVA
jgi:hypothetical protein